MGGKKAAKNLSWSPQIPLWVPLQFASCSFAGRLSINAAKLLLLLTLKQGNDSSIAQNAITPTSFFCRPSGVLNGMKGNVVRTQWGKLAKLMGGWDGDRSHPLRPEDLSPILFWKSHHRYQDWSRQQGNGGHYTRWRVCFSWAGSGRHWLPEWKRSSWMCCYNQGATGERALDSDEKVCVCVCLFGSRHHAFLSL